MASGLRHATCRPIRTRFRYASGVRLLRLATQQQLAGSLCKRHAVSRSDPEGPASLLPLVGTRFQVLFHSPSGVLFTFPSRYWFAIGLERVFSLTRWSSQIHAGFLGPRITWETATGGRVAFAYGTITLCGSPFQDDSTSDRLCNSRRSPQRPPRGSRDPVMATLAGLTP